MSYQFKESLKNHLSEFQTAPFLFVGSGLSRRYLNLDNWEGLLRKFSDLTSRPFEYYRSASNGKFPKLASILSEDFFNIWWDKEQFQTNRSKYETVCISRNSPLKVEISNYLQDIKDRLTTNVELLNEIELLRSSVIDGIITTNWDLFLENTFKDFVTYVGQESLIFSPSHGVGEIYKIHGCCTQPNSLILTEEDYSNFDKKNAYLAAKLITIFTEHPIIFIGYSLQDDNINQILKSIITCLSEKNLGKLQNRLIFVNYNETQTIPKITPSHKIYDSIQIPVTTIETNNFTEIFEVLKSLKRKIPAKVLRNLKEQVYDFVINTESRQNLHVIDIDDAEDFTNIEIVYGVGVMNRLKESSYTGFDRESLYNDIIFNNQRFDPNKIIELSLPKIIRDNSSRVDCVPIFKYLHEANLLSESGELILRNPIVIKDKTIDTTPEKVVKFFDSIIKLGLKYFEPNEAAQASFKKLPPREYKSINEFISDNSRYDFMKYFSLLYPKISLEEFEEFIRENYEELNSSERQMEKQQFKKMICFYDYLKYYHEVYISNWF